MIYQEVELVWPVIKLYSRVTIRPLTKAIVYIRKGALTYSFQLYADGKPNVAL